MPYTEFPRHVRAHPTVAELLPTVLGNPSSSAGGACRILGLASINSNAFKRIAAGHSAGGMQALFYGAAAKAYQLNLDRKTGG